MYDTSTDLEIDYKQIIAFFYQKKLLIKFTFISFSIRTLFAFSQKKIWQVNYQIVLQQDNKSSKLQNISGLSGLLRNNL